MEVNAEKADSLLTRYHIAGHNHDVEIGTRSFEKKIRVLSPRANYTNRINATCRRS
jgi:hypothetical protein